MKGHTTPPANRFGFKGAMASPPEPINVWLMNYAEHAINIKRGVRRGSILMLQLMREMEVIRGCPVPRAYIDQWHLNGVGKGYKWRLAGRLCAAGYMVRIDTKWRQRPSVQYSVTSAGLALIAEYDRIYKDGYDWLRVKQEDHARNVKMYNKRASEADKARISAKLALLSKK